MITREKAIEIVKREAKEKGLTAEEFIKIYIGIGKTSFYDWTENARVAVARFLDMEVEGFDVEEVVDVREGKSERRPKVERIGDKHIITYRGGKESIEVSERLLSLIVKDYTIKHYEINHMCTKYKFTREQFHAIKTAFDLTHSSIPYTEEEIENASVEELVDETLHTKKQAYYTMLRKREIAQLKRDYNRMRSKDYMIDKLKDHVQNLSIIQYDVPIQHNVVENTTLFVPIADVHAGMTIDSHWNEYSLEVMRERFRHLTEEIISQNNKASDVVVAFLGDILHGVIKESGRLHSAPVIESFKAVLECIAEMLHNLDQAFKNVSYMNINGNHDSIMVEKTARTAEDNFGSLVSFFLEKAVPYVHYIEGVNEKVGLINFHDYNIVVLHGDEGGDIDSKVRHAFEEVRYVFSAHEHNYQMRGSWFKEPSFCGPDHYAISKMLTDRPQTNIYHMGEKGIEKILPIYFSF